MSYGVKLHVWGDYACFTRPEMKVERVSYDTMTPSAARGILEAIHWKPAIRWVVERIHILEPIRFESLRRNELGSKIPTRNATTAMKRGTTEGLHTLIENDRQQRAATILRNVAYVVEARFVLTNAAGADDSGSKHQAMFRRRAAKGQCYHRPYLGTREFPADFALVKGTMPPSALPDSHRNRDLGWMLLDIDYEDGMAPRFFRAVLCDGVMDVPPLHAVEVKA